jgi:putative ABC transport system permease protein
MRFFEALGLALSSIKAHKLRSFLTLLGIIFGVATVIVVVSLIEGFNKYVDEKIADLGSNAFIVNKMGMVTSLQEWIDRNKKNKDIKLDDLRAIQEHPIYVRDAAAMMRRRGEVKRGTQTLQDVEMLGVSYNMIDIDTIKVGQGRYISHDEDEHSRYTCFVGYDIVNKFFPSVDPLDKEIKIDGRPFRIVGVAQEIGSVFGNPGRFRHRPHFLTYQNILRIPRLNFDQSLGFHPGHNTERPGEVRVIPRAALPRNYADPDNFDRDFGWDQ